MDTATLVEDRIGDGRRLLAKLARDEFEVTAAFWGRYVDDERWILFVVSEAVLRKGLAAAYRDTYGALQSLEGTGISMSDVKLIEPDDPLAADVSEVSVDDRGHKPARLPSRSRGSWLGDGAVEVGYIYPPGSWKGCTRQSFDVTYRQRGTTDEWDAITKSGDQYEGIDLKGAVGYSTARWEGEAKEDQKSAIVFVLVEIPPDFNARQTLDLPVVNRMMGDQARKMADEMFKTRHPKAKIHHAVYS